MCRMLSFEDECILRNRFFEDERTLRNRFAKEITDQRVSETRDRAYYVAMAEALEFIDDERITRIIMTSFGSIPIV